ncbi:hypothetical protein [Streptomyces sp. LN245]|uniref:hypothetical protein n=1 Tax=Streptomyces sp. LN245 TaxID=3112975 RepID=UPI0037151D14
MPSTRAVSGLEHRLAALLRIDARVRAGGALPMRAGEVIVQGEDLGTWAAAQQTGESPGVVVLCYAGLDLLDLAALGEVEDHDLPCRASA